MAAESKTILRFTLLEALQGRTRLSWLQLTAVVGLVLFALLGAAAYLNGLLFRPLGYFSWIPVRDMVWHEADKPMMIVYILSVQPVLRRWRDAAIEALRSLTAMDDDAFDRIVTEASVRHLRREWVAAGIGAAAGLLLLSPWSGPDYQLWPIKLYLIISTMLLYGLAGWFIYVSLADGRLFTTLLHHPLSVDVVDLTPFEPIARWSLSISLSIIGGITLGTLLNPTVEEFLRFYNIISNVALILVAILAFFLSTMSSHRVIVEAKEQKLRLVRQHLSAMFQELQEQGETGQVHAWLAYEKRIQEVSEWPFTAGTIRNLLISTLLPTAVFIGRMLALEAVRQLLFSP